MHRHRLRLTGIMSLAGLLLALGILGLNLRSAAAQEENLLVNPSFEGPYSAFIPPAPIPDCPAGTCGTAQTADGWTPWWQTVTGVLDSAIYGNPEYKPAEARDFANRVRTGERAQQYFNFGRTSTAGLFQTVSVPANSTVRFSVWGQAWSTGIGWDCELCDVPYSGEPTVMNMRIGIDPTGGANPFSPSIVWSGTASPYDQYAQFSVEATAQGDRVTVFTYSSPAEVRKHNDIYWDDASLVVVGGGGFVPAPVSGDGGGEVVAAPVFFELQPTATPDADGVIYAQVPPGGSLWSVAANAGITLDEILEYNNLSRNSFVMVGDLLIVGYGEPDGEAPSDTGAEVGAEASSTPEAAPEATPEAPPAPAEIGGDSVEAPEGAEAIALAAPAGSGPDVALAAAAPSGGSICLKAFLDNNENGLHDPGEPLKADVAFTIATDQRVVSNYVTTGTAEPYCIAGLAPGNYQVTRSLTSDEQLTTRGDWGVALNEGSVVTMEFGSKLVAASSVAAADTTAARLGPAGDTTAAAEAQSGAGVPLNTIITVVAVVLAVLLLGVVVALLLSTRRT